MNHRKESSTSSLWIVVTLFVAIGLAGVIDKAVAAPFTQESFDYDPGSIDGRDGGTGWSTDWTDESGTYEARSGSLTYTDGSGNALVTGGNKLVLPYGSGWGNGYFVKRNVDVSDKSYKIGGAGGGVMYQSFLLAITEYDPDNLNDIYNRIELVGKPFGENEDPTYATQLRPVDDDPTKMQWRSWGGTSVQVDVEDVSDVMFWVVKHDFTNDEFTAWLNPELGVEPTTGGHTWDGNGSYSNEITGEWKFQRHNTEWEVDEIRFGDTYADVTPIVPEPATFSIFLIGAAVSFVRRRSRR